MAKEVLIGSQQWEYILPPQQAPAPASIEDTRVLVSETLKNLTDPVSVGTDTNLFRYDATGMWLGAADWANAPFRVSMAGALTATSATISGAISASTIDIGGADATSFHVDIDGNMWLGASTFAAATFSASNAGVLKATAGSILGLLSVGSAAPTIDIDGSNKRIRTSTYASGLQGFNIDSDGSAEFNNITARGEFHSQVLSYGEVHTAAGSQIVAKSAGKLKSDATSVTSPTTFNVDIDDPDTGHTQVFAVSDVLYVKDGSGNANYWTISSVSDQTTFWRYVCTKSNGSNATFRAGAAIVDLGVSGDGYLYMTADDANGPFYSVKTHAGSPWSATMERLRLGNLNGFLDYDSDLYGLGIGETNRYFKYDPTNGLRVAGQVNAQVEAIAGENITSGQLIILKTTLLNYPFHSTDTFGPSDDARVDQANPTTNYGSTAGTVVGADAGGNANWFFLKWDLSNTGYPSSAYRCYLVMEWANQNALAGVASRHALRVYRVTGADWSEGSITWNTKPTVNGTKEDSWDVTPDDSLVYYDTGGNFGAMAGKYIFLDVTDLYNDWKSGGQSNYGVAVRLEKNAGGETTDVRITDLETSEGVTLTKPHLAFMGPIGTVAAFKADAAKINLSRGAIIGIAMNTATAGNTVILQQTGIATADVTIANHYFIGNTPGVPSNLPTVSSQRDIGIAVDGNKLLLSNAKNPHCAMRIQYTAGGVTGHTGTIVSSNTIPIFVGFENSYLRFDGLASTPSLAQEATTGYSSLPSHLGQYTFAISKTNGINTGYFQYLHDATSEVKIMSKQPTSDLFPYEIVEFDYSMNTNGSGDGFSDGIYSILG